MSGIRQFFGQKTMFGNFTFGVKRYKEFVNCNFQITQKQMGFHRHYMSPSLLILGIFGWGEVSVIWDEMYGIFLHGLWYCLYGDEYVLIKKKLKKKVWKEVWNMVSQ